MSRHPILLLLLALAAGAPLPASASPPGASLGIPGQALAQAHLQSFAHGTVIVRSANGPHTFTVELARTDAQKEQGLMYRQSMPADAGMWFDYSHDIGPAAFWMKNTYIPLDIIFIGTDGKILTLYERAVPKSLDALESGGPISGVLELNGGTTARLGLRPGDPVSFTQP